MLATIVLIGLAWLCLNVLVILHELGHYVVAKRNGVVVEEFGLGFGPKIVGRRLGRGFWRCYYSLNWLPLGGFVRLKGESDQADEPGSYGRLGLAAKIRVLAAGIGVNWAIAFIIFTVLAGVGLPRLLPASVSWLADRQQWTVASDTTVVREDLFVDVVGADSAAKAAGIDRGDRLISLDGQVLGGQADFAERLAAATDSVEIGWLEAGQIMTADVSLNRRSGGSPLDLTTRSLFWQRNTWSAPVTGALLTVQYSHISLEGIGRGLLGLTGTDSGVDIKETISGPVGIVASIKAAATQSFWLVLFLIGLISLSLALMNSLPIPALDGGRICLTLVYRGILRRPVDRRVELLATAISFILLLVLFVFVTIIDIGLL